MTKNIKRVLFSLTLLLASMQAFAEYVPTKVYIYGFSASFNDSTVYFTDVMELDSAWVERKTHFLYSRENYALQLKEYMQKIGVQNPTCVVSFAKDRKTIDKKMKKLRSKYTKAGSHYALTTLTESIFKFEAISAADDYAASHKETKEERKVRKAQEKAAIKKAKAEQKEKRKRMKAKPIIPKQ